MVKLTTPDLCTGCGACAYSCSKGCITMQENEIGIVLPLVDATACVDCHACEKACPVLNEPHPTKPCKAYAAWSNDMEERRTSASGGIAAEMYKMAIEKGYWIVGAVQQPDFSVEHEMSDSKEAVRAFKNSKYVFSSAYKVFPQIKSALKVGKQVLFVGLPCQVAALRKLFNDHENLLLVEVVCHGTTPVTYLRQHIDKLNRKCNDVAKRMSFRDPYTYTYTYTFTLYNSDNQLFYAKRTKEGDTYQFGYHRAVSYRENCYHCKFAKPERSADVVVADYSGLGRLAPASYNAKKVSLILENSDKGRNFVSELIAKGVITANERPLEEPFEGDPRLRGSNPKSKYRRVFEEDIKRYDGDFERAIVRSQRMYMRDEKLKRLVSLPKRIIKKSLKIIGFI